jgi:OOP family OmpA-OmpF porin
MLSKPSLKLEIQGHTDNVGQIDYNLDLSDRRAKAVMQKIIEGGVEERRLRARGFGMSKPIKPNETEEGRAANRRTEFVIIAK